MCVYFGLWGGLGSWFPVDHPGSTIVWRPQLWHSQCVPLSISLSVHILPNVLPRFLCDWPRKSLHLLFEGQNYPIVRFTYLCRMIGEEFDFLSFLYIQLFEFGLEIAFNHWSAVTHHKVNLLKFPSRSSSPERTDDDFVLLICFCFFQL